MVWVSLDKSQGSSILKQEDREVQEGAGKQRRLVRELRSSLARGQCGACEEFQTRGGPDHTDTLQGSLAVASVDGEGREDQEPPGKGHDKKSP